MPDDLTLTFGSFVFKKKIKELKNRVNGKC